MSDAILVLNAGSSSLKFSLFAGAEDAPAALHGQIEGLPSRPRFAARDAAGQVLADRRFAEGEGIDHDGAIAHLLDWLAPRLAGRELAACGHRVVHGGVGFSQPAFVDAGLLATLDRLVPLAPLHQPHNLAAIRAVAARMPGLPQVACFDTAFHRTQPEIAQLYALPAALTEEGIRRYGFHGLSYESIARRLPALDPRAAAGRTVVAHLGNGCSMTAMRACRSVATTMGFTPAEGLVMGTRAGSLDPGVILHLIERHGYDARAIEDLIYRKSGLLGVSGIAGDMRTLHASSDPRARLAIDLFVYRIGRELGSLAAALGGLDALVFTAGIGENDAEVRGAVCRDAAWLGVTLDEAANRSGALRIGAPRSRVGVWVIPTDEESVIARHTRAILAARKS